MLCTVQTPVRNITSQEWTSLPKKSGELKASWLKNQINEAVHHVEDKKGYDDSKFKIFLINVPK